MYLLYVYILKPSWTKLSTNWNVVGLMSDFSRLHIEVSLGNIMKLKFSRCIDWFLMKWLEIIAVSITFGNRFSALTLLGLILHTCVINQEKSVVSQGEPWTKCHRFVLYMGNILRHNVKKKPQTFVFGCPRWSCLIILLMVTDHWKHYVIFFI